MCNNQDIYTYSPEEYREFIFSLLARIDDVRILYRILAIVNRIFCEN